MTNEQLYIALGIPVLANASLIALLIAYMNARFQGSDSKFEAKFEGVNAKLDAINQRLDGLRELWRSELRRVEEFLDARLKHLEER